MRAPSEGSARAGRPAGSRRGRWLRIGLALACVAGLVAIVVSLGPRRVAAHALAADPLWLGLSVLAVVARFLVWGIKWQRMLAREAAVPFGAGLRMLLAGSFVNLTTPSAKLAGGVVRAIALQRRRGWPLATAYGWALADQATNVLGQGLLFGLLGAASPWLMEAAGGSRALAAAGWVALAALGLGTALRGPLWRMVRRPGLGSWLAARIPERLGRPDERSASRTIRSVLGPLLGAGTPARAFASDLALAATAFAALCAAHALALRAVGANAPLAAVAVAVVLGYFAGVLVGVWGGIGVTEVALTLLLVRLGIPPEQAAAAALLHRAGLYAVIVAWGGWAFAAESRLTKNAGAP